MPFFDEDYEKLVSRAKRGTPTAEQIRFIEKHVLASRNGASILDLCCGHGRHLAALRKPGRKLTGIDSSEPLIGIARRRLDPVATLRLGDVTACEFGVGFDAILCLENSFGFDDVDARAVMSRMRDSLAQDGCLVIHMTDPRYASASLPRRSWRSFGDEIFVLEERDHEGDRWSIVHHRFRRKARNGYSLDRSEVVLHLRDRRALEALGRRAGLRLSQAFGSFAGEPLGRDSRELICLFRRC